MNTDANGSLPLTGGIVFGVVLLLALVLTPLVRSYAIRRNWFDIPDDPRRVHRTPTPRIGGVAMYIAFVVGVGITFLPPPFGLLRNNPSEAGKIALLLIGCTIMAVVMFVDDVRGLQPRPKLAWQFFATALVMVPAFFDQYSLNANLPEWAVARDKNGVIVLAMDVTQGVLVRAVQNPFSGDAFNFVAQFGTVVGMIVAAAFTFFWIMGMVNTVNWMDGLDGLATGISAIACVVLFAVSIQLKQYTLAFLPLALCAALLGFLPYNFHPAKIFMGDSGAMFLGFALGVISIIGGAKIATALLVLGVPILDTAYVIIFRLIRGKSPLKADRGHLHHRLFDLGMTHRQVCLLYYFLCAGFGALALLPQGYGWLKLLTVAAMALLLACLLIFISRRQFDPKRVTSDR